MAELEINKKSKSIVTAVISVFVLIILSLTFVIFMHIITANSQKIDSEVFETESKIDENPIAVYTPIDGFEMEDDILQDEGVIEKDAVSHNITIGIEELHEQISEIVPVTSITGVPKAATARTALTITGTINPANATNKRITWSVLNAGGTSTTISGNTLSATSAGTATIRATVINGRDGGDFTQDFTIIVGPAPTFSVSASSNNSDFGRGAVWTGVGGEREEHWINTRDFSQSVNVYLRAFANQGYVFDKWEVVSGSIVFDDTTSRSTYFLMPAGNVTVKAVFILHNRYIVDASALNIRAEPNINSESIGMLYQDEIVNVTRVVAPTDDIHGSWAWIGNGWSNLDYLMPLYD